MSSNFQTGPHWLELAFWTSQICLALIAALTAWFAYHQLAALKRNSDQELGNYRLALAKNQAYYCGHRS